MKKLLIIGAGGHGRVVAEAAKASEEFPVISFADDVVIQGTMIDGVKVAGKIDIASAADHTHFIVALGNNQKRAELFAQFTAKLKAATIIHTSTVISPSARIGEGTVVLAGAIVSTGTSVGMNCIVNSQSLIDHDSVVENHCHISQGTIIGSNCQVREFSTTELGSRNKSFSIIAG